MRHDIETAQAGGVLSCAVLTGYNRHAQLADQNPDLIVEHLGELKRLLVDNNVHLPTKRQKPHHLSTPYPPWAR